VRHFRKYIAANLNTDRCHQEEIQRAVNKIAAAIDESDREPKVVIALCELCLLLLGDFPNHWDKAVVDDRPAHFKLNRHRTLSYSQTAIQRAHVIRDKVISPALLSKSARDRADAERLLNKLKISADKRYCADFVEAFCRTHPRKYVDLF
jgi:hypothetical protein